MKLQGQQWYQFKQTDSLDVNFKGYPSYILIDTTQIKDCSNVIVEHNSVRIKPQGNRFYLNSAPFKYTLLVDLNEQGQIDLKNLSSRVTTFISSNDFNRIHKDDFFKIQTNSDTVEVGKLYEAFIVIDSTVITDASSISITTSNNNQLKRTGYKFYFGAYQAVVGPKNYDLKIVKSNVNGTAETIAATIFTYGIVPRKMAESDFVLIPDIAPKFNGSEYKSFDDFFIAKLKEHKLSLSGKVFLCYTVMKDGKTRFEWTKGKITSDQNEIVKKIVTSYENWTPGKNKKEIVNVMITAVYDFRP